MKDAEPDSEASRRAVFEKLGRNLWLFQAAEYWLKLIASRQKIPADREAFLKEQGKVGKETLGGVATRVIDGPSEASEEEIARCVAEGKAHIESLVTFVRDPDLQRKHEEEMKDLVAARNDLTHHFFGRFDLNCEEGCREAEQYLDSMHATHLDVVRGMQEQVKGLADLSEMMGQLLKDEEVRRYLVKGPSEGK